MKQLIRHRSEQLPVKPFRWRDRYGNKTELKDLDTQHLFHIIRMVWDHSMPSECQTTFPNRYRFGKEYTTEYMADAIRFGIPEFFRRRDREAWMMYWIDFMIRHLQDRNLKGRIEFIRKINYKGE